MESSPLKEEGYRKPFRVSRIPTEGIYLQGKSSRVVPRANLSSLRGERFLISREILFLGMPKNISKKEDVHYMDIKKLQLKRLKKVVKKVYNNVGHYRKVFDERGITPDDINTLEDLKKLPFTKKDDFRKNYPYSMLAEPVEKIVRIHASSGTTGKPTVVGYTRKDIQTWAELMERVLRYAGVTERDVLHNAYGYGLFTGGLGFHYGAEKLGCVTIPISGGNTRRQVSLMKDLGATVLACTPSYALHIAETAESMGIDIRELPLKVGIFGAEPWSANMRKEIENRLGIKALDIYGLSEVIGPGVACECLKQQGLHIFEDHFIAEIIDPETEEVLPYGKTGELVLTSLTKEALPVIRYRTGDITRLIKKRCECGSIHVRMDKIKGRADNMLIVRGVNVFPSQIESVLMEMEGIGPHYLLVIEKQHALKDLELWVETKHPVTTDVQKKLENKIQKHVFTVVGIRIEVKVLKPKTIKRSEGKAIRVAEKGKTAGLV